MIELEICELWNVRFSEPTEDWFLKWVMRSPKDAGTHLTAGLCAYGKLEGVKISSATEYFGGIGAQSRIIQKLFSPPQHVVLDSSLESAYYLQSIPGVDVRSADSYAPSSYAPAELVGLDFGDFTAYRSLKGQPHRALLDRVFASKPKGVVITDVACRYLHLQRERYEALLGKGTCGSYPDYLNALAERIGLLYNYTMIGGFYHRWSTVMTFAPTGERGRFNPTPEHPVGLKIRRL